MKCKDDEIISLMLQPNSTEKGLRAMMDTYQSRLYWHIRRLIVPHDLAQDVLQDTFIKAYKNFGQFKQDSKLYTWLYRIATNEALQQLAKLKKMQKTDEDAEYYIPISKADIKKEGKDVTLVSFGKILKLAMQAAADLEQEGISVEVIDLRTIRPLDYETVLNSVKKTNRLVVLEEAWPFGSVASEITYMVQQKAFDYLDAPIKRITTPDAPAPYSAALFAEWFPKLEKVKQEIENVLYVKS